MRRAGAGAPPLVLLHGLALDAGSWQPVIDFARAHRECVAVDLPGHGRSRPVDGGVDDAAAAVGELLDELGAPAPVLAGHSMGGLVALRVSTTRPLAGLALFDLPLRMGAAIRSIQREAARSEGGRPVDLAAFERGLHLEALEPGPRRRLAAHVAPSEPAVVDYLGRLFERDPDELDRELTSAVRSLSCPLLAVHASAVPPRDDAWLARLAPSARVERWLRGGHFPHLADPARAAEALLALASSD